MTETTGTAPVHIDIDHIATLSRLALSAEEKETLSKELDSIAAFMADVQGVDTSAIETAASSHRNIFAADVVTEESGVHTKQLITDAAPQHSGDYLAVPQVITAGKHS